MQNILPITVNFLYIAAAIITALRLFGSEKFKSIPRGLVLATGYAAVILHAILLYSTIIVSDGVNLAFFQALSLSGMVIALVLMVSALTKPVENLAIFLFPGIAFAVLFSAASGSAHLLDGTSGWALGIHVIASLLAWSLLAIASMQAILLTIQDRHLHNRQPGGFVRTLPPLQTMESLLFEMIGTGMVLLTLSLVSGFIFLEDMFAQHLVHKTLLSLIAWCVFATLLYGRFKWGWRGRKALKWTLAGFAVLLLAYFGSKAVIELIL
ncbi:cytochrome C assembly family protein [Solemya velum gill symbiont]|nr:cytochrome c biogenesis protein CcsA [Solemya velum gill symbiont]OOY33875.1 cytochrome C biogenesis protein [Solemya velum gill symbiont]OOY36494.1 cytochrome C biogenesis protein [Solemya velum gill symbiont]OOY39085.1 cytochrome C biogenesis protein [Solemya velum gill symbiont]OOY43334.1 cytochrome C biogenesis protein [Solemya velum gill symbiont]OOY45579.1 cytochrome C biogenesis protein [Solemya velum gill symbiont]